MTSYFAAVRNYEGRKISIARFNIPKITGNAERFVSFAPSVKLLRAYQHSAISWEGYIQEYLTEQRNHFKETPDDFKKILDMAKLDDVVLLCYEKYQGPLTRCHRFLLYTYLQKVAKKWNYQIEFGGELRNRS